MVFDRASAPGRTSASSGYALVPDLFSETLNFRAASADT
jgi:hypothetical protein